MENRAGAGRTEQEHEAHSVRAQSGGRKYRAGGREHRAGSTEQVEQGRGTELSRGQGAQSREYSLQSMGQGAQSRENRAGAWRTELSREHRLQTYRAGDREYIAGGR